MEDNNLYDGYGRTSTLTETQTATTNTDYDYEQDTEEQYHDDYSVTPNYTEEQSYESANQTEETNEQTTYKKFEAPIVQRNAQTVVLTKTVQKIQLSARMKLVATMFSIIMASLMFLMVWNFVTASALNRTVDSRQAVVNELYQDISQYQETYNEISDEDNLRESARQSGYVDSNSQNTFQRELGDLYEEPTVEDIPSNWFNDFCDFLSKIFG